MTAAWRPRAALGVLVTSGCLLAALVPAAQAQSGGREEGRRTTIYRCDGGGSTTYSDTERCAGSTVNTNPLPAAKPIVGQPTAKLSLNGPPCPLPANDPDGPAWASLRACYRNALQQQPEQTAGEQQLAGVLMGQCEAETQALAQGRNFPEVVGRTPVERRQAIRRWSQWLVQQSGRAADTVPVQLLHVGKAVPLNRLSGPAELQLPDGQITEALPGALLRPGDQLYLRKGVGLQVGGQTVTPQANRDRCLRID